MKIKALLLFLKCILLCWLVISCSKKQDFINVKTELLKKFEGDSLKLKAAILLYRMARTAYSHQSSMEAKYIQVINQYKDDPEKQFKLFTNLKTETPVIEVVPDSTVLTSSLLIQHVEKAFEVWDTMPWKDQVNFDTFCRYILPYKIDIEKPELWITAANTGLPDSLKGIKDIREALLASAKVLTQTKNDYRTLFGKKSVGIPVLPYSGLKNLKVGSCEDLTRYGVYVSRAYGFPTAKDFTPMWANASSGHTWCALILDSTKCIPFNFKVDWWDPFLGTYKSNDRLESKVYRQDLMVNPESHASLKGKSVSYLPDFFNNPGIIDVTDQYVDVTSIKVPVNKAGRFEKIAYLSVLSGFAWAPVGWGTIKNNVATFEKIVKGAVYNSYLSQKERLIPFGYPFVVTNEGTKIFKPNHEKKDTIVLTRKFPLQENIKQFIRHMVGGKFQGANKPDFSDSVDLYTITESPGPYYHEIEIKNDKEFKYYRYKGINYTWSNVGEIEFYGENKVTPLKGTPIGGEPSRKNRGAEAAFDGDPVSFYEAKDWCKGWVGMAYNKSFALRKIRFIARTDYNIIVPGNEYELFYWNGVWKTLGKQVAISNQLVYPNAPFNSIFYLKNLTSGNEERIFSYEHDEQIWW